MNSRQPQVPISLVFFLIAIAVVNAIAHVNHLYWTERWFDMPMHFAGGAWLAGFGVWWKYYRNGLIPQSFLSVFTVGILFSFGIGLLWEVYEAVVSYSTVGHMNEIADTLADLMFDILGGTVVALIIFTRIKSKNK